MSYRIVTVSNPAKLHIKDNQLVVTQDASVALPIEDIAALVLDHPAIVLSSVLLSRMTEAGVLVVTVDSAHMPSGALVPFDAHSITARSHRLQIDSKQPFQKRCWQIIVQQKIRNQATCLELAQKHGADKVQALAELVQSGDRYNIEARAASTYFAHLFGDNFVRDSLTITNSALNYGYAVIRSIVARALSAHGLLLTFGLFHHNKYNAFNLVDDMMEPFRPVVDLYVASAIDSTQSSFLSQEHRRGLLSLLACDMSISDHHNSIMRTAELSAGSLLTALTEKNPSLLKVPRLLPLVTHHYD